MKPNKLFLIEIIDEVSLGDKEDEKLAEMVLEQVMESSFNEEDFDNISFCSDTSMLIYLPEDKVNIFNDILSQCCIETIKQEIDIEYINEHLINIDDYETQAIIGKYRKSNTSIDDVLDKINNQGIETLDVIDLEILLSIT